MLSLFIILLTVLVMTTTSHAENNSQALQFHNGWPQLVMPDGQVKLPLLMFQNTEGSHWPEIAPQQVKMVSEHGVHLYSFVLHAPMEYAQRNKDKAENFVKAVEERLELFKLDSNGYWMPRIHLSRTNMEIWSEWEKKHPGNLIQLQSGEKLGLPSIASEAWFEEASASLITLVDYLEKHYSKKIFAYHVDFWGETCYWGYGKGLDASPVILKAFRKWLQKRYGDLSSLQKAWQNSEVNFDNAEPASDGPFSRDIDTDLSFVDPIKYRDHLDYLEFFNEMVAERVKQFAALIKSRCGARKLTVSFYGYLMQVSAPLSGHWGLPEVLRDGSVDAMCAPMAYNWRQPGGAMPAVGPIDSFNLWGKLWFNEDDENTFLRIGSMRHYGGSRMFPTVKSILQSHKRNFGFLLTHGLGTWWMDLWGDGALAKAEIWEQIAQFHTAYKKIQNSYPRTDFSPDVAILVDTKSSYYLGSRLGQRLNIPLLNNLRDSLYRLGSSTGIYLMSDIFNENFPTAKAYIFLNAFHMNEKTSNKIKEKIHQKNKLAIWIWAPPIFNEQGENLNLAKEITGLNFKIDKNAKAIANIRLTVKKRFAAELKEFAEDHFGSTPYLSVDRWSTPVIYVEEDKHTEILGNYFANYIDGRYSNIQRAAFAIRKDPEVDNTNVFIGSTDVPATILRGILRESGVHLWSDREDIVHVGPSIVSITATEEGLRKINFPSKVKLARDLLNGEVFGENVDTCILDMEAGDTIIIEMIK